jgi:WD40 repeat protein
VPVTQSPVNLTRSAIVFISGWTLLTTTIATEPLRTDDPKFSVEGDKPKLLYTHALKNYPPEWLGFSGDGAKLFILTNEPTEGKSRRLVLVWDAATGKQIRSLGIQGVGSYGAVSSDGTRVVLDEFGADPTVRDMKGGEVVATLKGHKARVLSARFSPDGTKVVTASEDKTAKVWEAATGKCLTTLTGHSLTVASAEFSPDGKRIATGSYAGEIKIWDVEKGECLIDLKGMSTSNNPTIFDAGGLDRGRRQTGSGVQGARKLGTDCPIRPVGEVDRDCGPRHDGAGMGG